MNEEKIESILKDSLQKMGWYTWSKKQSTLFSIKSKYGSSLDNDIASEVYDKIYDAELQRKEKDYE